MIYDGLPNCLSLRISNLYIYIMCGLSVNAYHNLPIAKSVGFWGLEAAPFFGSAFIGGLMYAMLINHYRFQKAMIMRAFLLESQNVARFYMRDGNVIDAPLTAITYQSYEPNTTCVNIKI